MNKKMLKALCVFGLVSLIFLSFSACQDKNNTNSTKNLDEKKDKAEENKNDKNKEDDKRKELEKSKKEAKDKLEKAKTKEEKENAKKELQKLEEKEKELDQQAKSKDTKIIKVKEKKTEEMAIKQKESTSTNKKPADNNKPKESSNSTTKPVEEKKPTPVPKPNPKPNKPEDTYEYKTTSSTSSIPFKTIDNYSSSGGKTKIIREGEQGTKVTTYKITYKNGSEIERNEISTKITKEPVDKIIARYVKVQDEKYETQKVDDTSKPIYEYEYKERWFVETIDNKEPYEYKYFYNENEAFDYYDNYDYDRQVRWGTAEDEEIKTLKGYEQKTIEKKVQDEVWDWKY